MVSKLVYLLILASILFGVGGQFSLKVGVSQLGVLTLGGIQQLPAFVFKLLFTPVIFFGLCLYAIGAFLWMVVLSRVDLSFAYPFVALNYVFVFAGSALFLHEHVPANRFLGAAIIVLGVLIVARR